MQIIFLPFAGANCFSYIPIQNYLKGVVDARAMDVPGRGNRIREPLLYRIEAMVDDLSQHLRQLISAPYAFFGHSMGAILAYLLAHRFREEGREQPVHLFCSGRQGPEAPEREEPYHTLPRERFLAKLREMGGSPDEILQNEELMEFYEPILRADFQAVETYRHSPKPPLDIPITAMIGNDENIEREEAALWQHETTREITLLTFPGQHFFLFDQARAISDIVLRTLTAHL